MRLGKTSLRQSGRLPVSARPSRPSRFAPIMLAALCFMSCRTARTLVPPASTDSIRAAARAEIRQESVLEPARLEMPGEMLLTLAQIGSLPVGAEYAVQTDQARASARKAPEGALVLSVQGICPAKAVTKTTATADTDAKGVQDYSLPKSFLKDGKTEFKWWPDGLILGSILFAILSISCLFWSATQKQK